MNKNYQNLITHLSTNNTLLLTALLSNEDKESWDNNKHLLVRHIPRITLEMAIHQISGRKRSFIPSPNEIYRALNYAQNKNCQRRPQFPIKLAANE